MPSLPDGRIKMLFLNAGFCARCAAHVWTEQVRKKHELKHWGSLWEEKEEKEEVQWKASWSICYFLIILRGFFASISKLRWLVLCLSSSCPHTFLLNLAVKRMWKQSQFCFPFAKQLRDPKTWLAYELDVIFQNLSTYGHITHKSEKPMRSFGL